MKNQTVRLNFLPLKNNSFNFKIFVKDYEEPKLDALYRAKLSFNDENNWKDYLISFTNFEKGKEKLINSDLNPNVTTKFMFHQIEKIAKKKFPNETLPSKKKFERKIYFILKKHTEGYETVWLQPYYLNCKKQFGFLIDFNFKCHDNTSFSKRIQVLSLSLDKNFQSNKNFYIDRYGKIEEFLNKYFDKILENLPDELKFSKELEPVQSDFLSPKKYVFASEKNHKSQFMGVKNFGPFLSKNNLLHIPILYEKGMIHFARELKESLEGRNFPTFDGFNKMFRMEEKIYMNSISLDQNDEDFKELIGRLKKFKESNAIVPIIILDSEENQKYFDLKYFMLKNGLPFQVITKKLITNKSSLKWSITNIALQIFSKSGGTPWKVKPSNGDCLIFGLGQAHCFEEKKIIKYFSYSVCTDSSGLYKKIDVLGKSETQDDYLEQLKDNILKIVKKSEKQNIKKIVFHVPFKIKAKELSKIYEGINSFKETNDLNLIVIRVNSKNNFFGYSDNNTLIPLEGTLLTLSNKEYLIWFEGMQLHRKNILNRIPGPVFIEFLWFNCEISFQEKKSYLQDLLNLSGTNWRGFNAKSLPISIYYCQIISKFLAKFPDEIHNIDNFPEPWFL